GNAIGTVPAIANDINGGMDPTKAIVSESAGTAAGLAVGTWAGSAAAGALAGSGARGRNSRRFRRGRCCRRGNRLRSLQERAMDMVVTETNPPPPVLTILRHWDDRPSAAAVVLTTGIGILFLAMTLLWSAITVSNLGHDNPAVPVGCLGVAILAAGAASLAGSRLLFLSDRIAAKLAPPVTARTDPAWG